VGVGAEGGDPVPRAGGVILRVGTHINIFSIRLRSVIHYKITTDIILFNLIFLLPLLCAVHFLVFCNSGFPLQIYFIKANADAVNLPLLLS
jgi:hypothetical protein